VYKLNHLDPNDNPAEYSGQVQGDMLIDEEELKSFNGRTDLNLRWPNNIVNYWINDTLFSEGTSSGFH
jgi:hypothetical protein